MSRMAVVFLVGTVLVAGCSNRVELPLYGKWEGAYDAARPGVDLKGYLQLYATNHKFKMRIGNYGQTLDTLGNWNLRGRQVLLKFTEINFEGVSKDQAEARKLVYLPPSDVRTAYGHELVLNLSSDSKTLTGLPMGLGGLTGHHVFQKAITSSYVR